LLSLFDEELTSKPEWAAIQIVELQHRDKPSQQMEFVTTARYSLVGIPVADQRKKVLDIAESAKSTLLRVQIRF